MEVGKVGDQERSLFFICVTSSDLEAITIRDAHIPA